jgi:hypothetical protein
MPHDHHLIYAKSSRWEPNPPDYWPNTSVPDPEKPEPVPGRPDPKMPPPEPRRKPSTDHGGSIGGREEHHTPSATHGESEKR